MQNGVDISQIRRVRDTYEKMKKGNAAYGATTKSLLLTAAARTMVSSALEEIKDRLQMQH